MCAYGLTLCRQKSAARGPAIQEKSGPNRPLLHSFGNLVTGNHHSDSRSSRLPDGPWFLIYLKAVPLSGISSDRAEFTSDEWRK
jgi:hypothetical protein